MEQSTEYRGLATKETHQATDGIPRILINLWQKKWAIGITWSIIFLTGGIIPVVLYFALRYGAHLKLSDVLAITSALFGAFNVFSLGKRTWDLVKKDSRCRPLGGPRWGMDFFNINYIINFIAITVIIIVGNIILSIRTVVLGLPILIAVVSAELFLVAIFSSMGLRSPVRISSIPAGEPFRSGVYCLAEDICAVDGGFGQTFREQLQARYLASRTVRKLCWEMDLIWGVSGLIIGVGTAVMVFVIPSANVSYALGWGVPWAYAAIMAVFTIVYCRYRLKNEQIDHPSVGKTSVSSTDSSDTAV